MKRSIICKECAFKNLLENYSGEWAKRVFGKIKGNIILNCDLCNKELLKDDDCCAESSGLTGHPYYPWEDQYIR